MCGIVGTLAATPVNQLIYDALLLLQHRGRVITKEQILQSWGQDYYSSDQ